jgi:hypothetical protein
MSNGNGPEARVAEPGTSPVLFETKEVGDGGVVAVYKPLSTGDHDGGLFFSWVNYPNKTQADRAIEEGVAMLDKDMPGWERTYASAYVRERQPKELPEIDTTRTSLKGT